MFNAFRGRLQIENVYHYYTDNSDIREEGFGETAHWGTGTLCVLLGFHHRVVGLR